MIADLAIVASNAEVEEPDIQDFLPKSNGEQHAFIKPYVKAQIVRQIKIARKKITARHLSIFVTNKFYIIWNFNSFYDCQVEILMSDTVQTKKHGFCSPWDSYKKQMN